ncbi:alginate O-acetyltransferase AlgX-related protein [Nitrospira sp. M1]
MKKQTPLLNVVLVCMTIAVMVVVMEAFLRVYFFGSLAQPFSSPSFTVPHPTRTIAYGPGLTGWHQELDFNVPVHINAQGLRGPDIGPKDHRQRILFVADSTTFGSGVPVEQIIPTRLTEELGADRVEIINGGFATYNTVQELLFLEEEGLSYKPDLVILAFSPNTDIQTNTLVLQELHQKKKVRAYASLDDAGQLQLDLSHVKPFYEREKDRTPEERLKAYHKRQVLYRLGKMLVGSFKTSKFHDPNMFIGWPFLAEFAPEYSTRGMSVEDYTRLWDDGWAVTKALILRMREQVLAQGATFAMTVMAPKLQVENEYQAKVQEAYPQLQLDLTRINRVFEEFGQEAGIPVLDSLTVLVEAARQGESGLYYSIEDEHMTAKSHQLVATSLARQLHVRGLVKSE